MAEVKGKVQMMSFGERDSGGADSPASTSSAPAVPINAVYGNRCLLTVRHIVRLFFCSETTGPWQEVVRLLHRYTRTEN